jgi:heterodisulfide reductase subunit A-like polyferredoxin
LTRGARFPKIAPTFTMKNALVVGAGVTGCSAALELARLGTSVTVLERSGRVGGKVLSYCCKATDLCSRCGVCVAHDAIAEAIRHPKIRFLPNATIEKVEDSGSRVAVMATGNVWLPAPRRPSAGTRVAGWSSIRWMCLPAG